MSDKDASPLGRWSARKAEARREAEVRDEDVLQEAPDEKNELTEIEKAEQAEIVAKLPDIDSLDKDSDYSIFMSKGVPEHLKRMALRKLWLSDPILANVDGLVDYGEDFTTSPLMGDAVKTIYRVGKGLMSKAEEIAEKEALENADQAVDQVEGDAVDEIEGDAVDEIDLTKADPEPDDQTTDKG